MKTPYALLIIAMLIMVGGAIWLFDLQQPPPLQPHQIITSLPARDLILQEVTFDIITKASISEAGSPILYFASAGAFGKGAYKVVLFRGCLKVRYGVDLEGLAKNDCILQDRVLTLNLPEPQIIGEPVILTDESCQSRIIDIQGEGWWSGYVQRADIQTRIHQAYVENAPALCKSLDMEQRAEERAERVLTALLMPILKEKNLTLVIQWPMEQSAPDDTNLEQKGGEHAEMGLETGGYCGFAGGGGDSCFGGVEPVVWSNVSIFQEAVLIASGHPGNVEFNLAPEPFCGVQDGAFGTGRPGWLQTE